VKDKKEMAMNGGDGGSGSTSKIRDLEEEDLVPKNII
jgi:hypothetical protein